MRTTRRTRGVLTSIVVGAVLVTGSLFGSSAATAAAPTPPPTSMAALGDSITQALMTCSSFSGCPTNSWSTGSAASVNSHATRLHIAPASAFNDSVSGATSSGLLAQAQKAVTQQAQYVTIEIGANDACTKTVGAMTPTATFATNVSTALSTLAAGAAHPQIFVASIPSLTQLYNVNKNNGTARFIWSILGICQSMLANPTSTSATDNARRAAVQTRVDEYNAALKAACTTALKCYFDTPKAGGTTPPDTTVANYLFKASDISTRDYFHPSLSGQAVLAQLTWDDSQWTH